MTVGLFAGFGNPEKVRIRPAIKTFGRDAFGTNSHKSFCYLVSLVLDPMVASPFDPALTKELLS